MKGLRKYEDDAVDGDEGRRTEEKERGQRTPSAAATPNYARVEGREGEEPIHETDHINIFA